MWIQKDPYDNQHFPEIENILKFVNTGKRLQIPEDCIFKKLIEKSWKQNPHDRPSFDILTKSLSELSQQLIDKEAIQHQENNNDLLNDDNNNNVYNDDNENDNNDNINNDSNDNDNNGNELEQYVSSSTSSYSSYSSSSTSSSSSSVHLRTTLRDDDNNYNKDNYEDDDSD